MAVAISSPDQNQSELRNEKEIRFVPSDEFDQTSEQDFELHDVDLYTDEEIPELSKRSGVESFLIAVEQSRILTADGEKLLFKKLNFLRFRANALQATAKFQRKSKKKQAEISRLIEESKQTREQIACANLRLITSISRRLSASHQEFEEFLCEANTILLKAIDKFDYSKGFRFSTYVTHAVQRHLYRMMKKLRRQRLIESDNSESELTAASGNQDEGMDAQDVDNAIKAILDSITSILDEREQRIIRARFGLDGNGKGQSMREIGDQMGLSKERVRQIVHSSVEKLAKFAKPLEASFEFPIFTT